MTKSKFKVGDRVRVACSGICDWEVGVVSAVTHHRLWPVVVKPPKGGVLHFAESELELAAGADDDSRYLADDSNEDLFNEKHPDERIVNFSSRGPENYSQDLVASGEPPGTLEDMLRRPEQYGIKFRHFVSPQKGHLRATVATLHVPADLVLVSAAICNRKDRPSKEMGRKLALERLMRGRFLRSLGYPLGECLLFTREDLAFQIKNRTILECFPGGKGLRVR